MTRKKAIVTIILFFLTIILSFFIRNFFNKKRNSITLENSEDIISEIAETIIPASDSPGAKEAGVAIYIINVLMNCTLERDRNNFITGLDNLIQYSSDKFSISFMKCKTSDRILILRHFESKGSFSNPIISKIRRKIFGPSFFEQIKFLTVSGYCMSKLGATKGLEYDYIPRSYIACIPLGPRDKSWATK